MENGNNSAREVLDPLVVCGERELCGKTALCWQCCGGTGLTADPTGGGQPVHPTLPVGKQHHANRLRCMMRWVSSLSSVWQKFFCVIYSAKLTDFLKQNLLPEGRVKDSLQHLTSINYRTRLKVKSASFPCKRMNWEIDVDVLNSSLMAPLP